MLLELVQPEGEEPFFKKLEDLPAGFMYGMAVYTTFRLPLAEHWIGAHLDRLLQNANQLGLMVNFSPEALLRALLPHFQLEKPVFRLTLVADVEEYSDFYTQAPKPARLLLANRTAPGDNPMPLSLKSVDYTRPMPLIKHLGMAEVITLKKQARLIGYQEILLAGDGLIREASTANIFFIRDGALLTPHPERDECLPGITRQRLLKLAENDGIPMRDDGPIQLCDLAGMQGAFLTNSAKGLMPVSRVDNVVFPWPEQAKAIASTLANHLD
jgi:branched-subunit amino acid aminotransferase/4-amino-4-deoxychorismate lyase